MTPASRKKICYGVDVDGGALTITRCTRTRKGIRADVVLESHGAPGETVVPLPEAMRRDIQSGRAERAATLPCGSSFTRWLRTPFASRAKAAKVFPTLLDIQLPFALEDCSYAFLEMQRTEASQVEALAVAARNEDVRRRIDELEQLGINPEALDHEGLALWTEHLEEVPIEADAVRVVAWLGHTHCTLVVGVGARFVTSRGVQVGLRDLLASPDPATTEAPALRQFVRRAQQLVHGHMPESGTTRPQWLWTGPGAELAADVKRLEDALGDLNVTFLTHGEPSSFLARALGRRHLTASPMMCNFRTGAFLHEGVRRRQSREQSLTAACALAAGVLLCGASIAWQQVLDARKQHLQSRITTLAAKLTAMPPASIQPGHEVTMVEQHLADQSSLISPFLETFEPSLTHTLRDILGTCTRHKLFLDTLTIRGDAISLAGATDDWNRCAPLEHQLRKLGFDVTVHRPDAGADELVHFSMQGKRTP